MTDGRTNKRRRKVELGGPNGPGGLGSLGGPAGLGEPGGPCDIGGKICRGE